MNSRWLYLAVAVALCSAWMLRWEIFTQHAGDRNGAIYLLDRWTGTLRILDGIESVQVKEVKE